MSACMSQSTPPAAVISSLQPGSSSSSACTPRAWMAGRCRLCGTPRRGAGSAGSVSLSYTVTFGNTSLRAAAASSPPMLAPITTACAGAAILVSRCG
jgi:hypothetical protein